MPLVHRGHTLEMLDRLHGCVRRRHLDAGIVECHVEPAFDAAGFEGKAVGSIEVA